MYFRTLAFNLKHFINIRSNISNLFSPSMKGSENVSEMEVYTCTFEANINQATMAIKFPCTYTVEIKSINNKLTMATTKNRVSAVDSVAVFNEVLKFQTELLYNPKSKQFIKKDVLVLLNLISNRKPDQQKLVGRVVVDLSQSIQSALYAHPQLHKLDYCSVNANITFSVKFMGKKLSSTMPQNFERDSFSDFQSFIAGVNKDTAPSKQRSFEESEKTVEMPWKTKNAEGFDRNKIIEESHNEDADSRINTGRTSHKIIGSSQNIPKQSFSPQTQALNLPRLNLAAETYTSSNKNSGNIPSSNIPSRSFYLQNLGGEQQGSRVKPDKDRSNVSPRNQSYQPMLSQPINQYEQILRSSHAQQKRIWDEEKRLLNEQILREKQQSFKQKERNQSLEKKAYQTELKLCNIEGRIENSKRQLAILEREKDLEIKDLRSKLDRATKEKNEKLQYFQLKEAELRETKEKLRSLENEKRRTQEELTKEQEKMHEKVEVALKRVMSSEELVSKLQKEKKESCDSLLELEKRNMELWSENTQLKSKVDRVAELERQISKLKNQKSEIQRNAIEVQQKCKLAFELEKGELLRRMQVQKQQRSQEWQSKIEQLKRKQAGELEQLRERMEQLEILLSQNELQKHDLQLQIEEKEQKMAKMNEDLDGQLGEIRKQEQHLNEIIVKNLTEIDSLSSQIGQLQQENAKLSERVLYHQSEDRLKTQELEQLRDRLRQKDEGDKQGREYVQNLENQILAKSDELTRKTQEYDQLIPKIETLQNIINEMKAYEKGLQQELLNMHENNVEAEFNALLQKQKQLTEQFGLLKFTADQTICELQSNIKELNQVVASRNLQIQQLSKQRNETKEYVLNLETEILKLNTQSEQGMKENKLASMMQAQLTQLKSQNKQKDTEMDNLKIANIQLKEYQIGLEEQILKMNEEIESLVSHNNPSEPRVTQSPEKSAISFEERERLLLRVRQLERTLEEKKIYERQLEEKILSDHKLNDFPNGEKERIKQLELTIKHLKQYQEGLEEKIINDHNQIEYTNRSSELVKKIRGQEQTIQHLKEYQEGLEQKILQDHEEMLKENALQDSIKDLEATIKQQREYQHGLEQKILEDHQIIDKLDIYQKREEPGLQPHLHQYCEKQKINLQSKIQKLQHDIHRISEAAKDEELLTLQKQIDERDQYIQQLEMSLRNYEKKLYDLEEKVAQLVADKEKHNKENLEAQQEQNPDTIAFNTVIRIIEAHSAESEGDAEERVDLLGSNSVEKQSIQKSMISQPPSIMEKDQLADLSEDMSNRSHQNKRSEDDNSPQKLMVIDEMEKNPKANSRNELQRGASLQLNKQLNANPISLFFNMNGHENKANGISNELQEKQNEITKLSAQLKQKHAQVEELIKEVRETQQKALRLDSQNKFYQKRIKELENEKPAPAPQEKSKEASYVKQLEKTVQQYEHKIKALKSKQMKIQEALAIIEQESYKIVGQLSQKEKECEELRVQILNKDKQIQLLSECIQAPKIENKSSPEDTARINELIGENAKKQQQIAQLNENLAKKEAEIKKWEEVVTQTSQVQEDQQKQHQESRNRIEKLQKELKQVNEQLMTSKRLVGKLRENKQAKSSLHIQAENNSALNEENRNLKKRIEELEEEMFSYQANQNEKDIEIEGLKNDVITLRQQIEKTKTTIHNEAQETKEQKLKQKVDAAEKLRIENEELRDVISIIKSDNQELNRKMSAITEDKNTEVIKKEQEIKALSGQISKLQSLIKAERLDYFNQRRELSRERDEHEEISRLQRDSIANKEMQLEKLKLTLAVTQGNLSQATEKRSLIETELEQTKNKLGILSQQLQQKKQEMASKLSLVELLQNRILFLQGEIANKDKEIRLLNEEIVNSSSQVDLGQFKQMQNELNFYSEELGLVTRKLEEIQPIYNGQKLQIENLQKVVEELNSQLLICQQQNEFNQQKLLKAAKAESKEAYQSKVSECNRLTKIMEEMTEQFNFIKESHQAIEKANSEKILELENKCRVAESEKQKAIEELEQKQMEHMNTELDLHFKLRQKNEKSQLAIGSSLTDNQNKKSLNGSQEVGVVINDIIPASRILKEIITNRTNRPLSEKQIEVMVIRITQLEEQLFGISASTKEKGLILEKARLLSMEFSKIKVNVMKSKMASEERMKFLTSLKPFQNSIKDILNLSEIYSENLLSSDLTSENLSRI